jgi:predicted amidophosphoribosyltransferase
MSYLLTPAHGPDICPNCFNPTAPGFEQCFACTATEQRLDAVVPISYCLAGGPLHHDLLDYKRAVEPAVPLITRRLAALLDTFLDRHERCVAAAAAVDQFDLVTTVPSNHPERDEHHPLRTLVGQLCPCLQDRHRRLLRRTSLELPPRTYNPGRFATAETLTGCNVLLIDDVWTTGSSAQSAAAALKRAGAAVVAAVVIGRYVNGDWRASGERLGRVAQPFDHHACVICALDHAHAA